MVESTQSRGDSGSSAVKRKCPPYQQYDDDYDDDDGTGSNSHNGINSSWNSLSEDVVHHIHALMPLRDAALAACVSRSFRRSWRHYPNLTFGMKQLGLIGKAATVDEGAMDLLSRIDHIFGNHSGIGVKTLELHLPWNWNRLDTSYVDRFLKTAIAPGIQELTVMLPSFRHCRTDYNFPCSLLSGESGRSIRYLKLTNSSFHPTAGLGCLTRLHLRSVRIGDDELGYFLSNSLALRHLLLSCCGEIICLKIPCLLRHLRSVEVFECEMLHAIESNAPDISSVDLGLGDQVDFSVSLGDGSSQVKQLRISPASPSYALGKLPSITPGVEVLNISLLPHEQVSTPMVPGKFHHLKYLNISLPAVSAVDEYDYLSLLAFLDASPALETLVLRSARIMNCVNRGCGRIHCDVSHLTREQEFRHGSLKNVTIYSFYSAESLIELTCRMLKHTASLECLTLDTTYGYSRCSSCRSGRCFSMDTRDVLQAQKALVAIRRRIKPQVPCNVNLIVVEPCSSCHVSDN
ncbi:hypothetical protein VPH35_083772 [Triticum aestivum]|uniref:uncharacterized protein isoform X1 n=1 Tax=Triticum aestivum TaxID=4565 RepID=UPI001D001D5B|nr:uncharacterized protein LOC123104066 isoform X1 [Triticum aestivum]